MRFRDNILFIDFFCGEFCSLGEPHQLKPVAYPELRELCFGEWEGLSVTEVENKFPNQLDERLKDIEGFHVLGGETFEELRQRVIPRFEKIIAKHSDEQIAMVCHGGVNRVILSHLLEVDAIVVLRCQPETLRARLEDRSYSPSKITANVEWEMLSGTWSELLEFEIEVPLLELDTTAMSAEELRESIVQWVDEGLPSASLADAASKALSWL